MELQIETDNNQHKSWLYSLPLNIEIQNSKQLESTQTYLNTMANLPHQGTNIDIIATKHQLSKWLKSKQTNSLRLPKPGSTLPS